MGSQGPWGLSSGIRRPATPWQVPASCLRGSNPRLRCLGRRKFAPPSAIGYTEVPSASWTEAEVRAPSRGTGAGDDQLHARVAHHPTPPPTSHHQPQAGQPSSNNEQHRLRQQQKKHEAANQLVQRLVPPTPVASATQLPTRGGVSAGGVALGILLTVALQMVGRWLQRQRWGQQLMELMDLRRNSGSSASTSDRDSADEDGVAGDSRRDGGRRGKTAAADGREGAAGGGGGEGTAAATKSAFVGGSGATGGLPGSLPGSPLSTMDGSGASSSAGGAGPGGGSGLLAPAPTGLSLPADPGESVEWVNMCWRKVWRVYQRGLERWIIDLLQPVFDGLVKDGAVPRWLCRLRVVELTLDHEAPYFSNMRRRNSRKDSDLNGVVDLRYTGGARMLLMLELGEGRWRFKVPVLVSDLDLECQMWLKLRLAPMCPWIGTISLAFVGPPNVKVQLSPYNRVRLMRVPVVQNYLRKLLTVDLPGLMVLPQRLEINIPPSVTTIAEAAVGRDTIMRAVASAVLQADAVEAALLAALPLGPQTPAGGVSLPDAFKGELSFTLREARNLPVWGFPGQSNPYARLVLGEQAVQSRREGDTSHPGRHRAPVWNQEFQFLVEDPAVQVLEMLVKDSHLTGRTEVGRASIRLADLLALQQHAEGGKVTMWVPLQPPASSYAITGGEPVPTGEVLVELSYKAFDDDEQDSGYREAENFSKQAAAQAPITDIRSAAAASSRAAVAASAAVSAIAMTRAAAARAAARAARAAQEAAAAAAGAAKGAVDQGASIIGQQPLGGAAGAAGSDTSRQQGADAEAASAKPPALLPSRSAVQPSRQTKSQSQPTDKARQAEAVSAAVPLQAGAPERSASQQTPPVPEAAAAREDAGAAGAVPPVSSLQYAMAAAEQVRLRAGADCMEPDGELGPGAPGSDDGQEPQHDVERAAWALEARAKALAAADVTVAASALPSTAATAAAAAAVGARQQQQQAAAAVAAGVTATATAVLDRPRVGVEHVITTTSGGGGGDEVASHGSSYGRRTSDNGNGHDKRGAVGGGGGDGQGPSPSSILDVEVLGLDGALHTNGYNGRGSVDGPAPSTPPALTHAQPGSPSDVVVVAESQLAGERGAHFPRQHPGHQGGESLTADSVVDGGATGAPPPSADAVSASSGGASGSSGGSGGPVLSALASLSASAQSLTASALGKARESLTHRPQPSAKTEDGQQQQSAPLPAQPQSKSEEGGSGSGGPTWLDVLVSKLPRYGGGADRALHHDHADVTDPAGRRVGAGPKDLSGSDQEGSEVDAASASSSAGLFKPGEGEGEDHPWWQFWVPKGGAVKLRDGGSENDGGFTSSGGGGGRVSAADQSPSSSSTDSTDGAEGKSSGRGSSKPWWQFWGDGGEDREKDREGGAEGGGRLEEAGGIKPVEAIYIPPDLPLEEIAAEVQRLKEDSWRERSDHVSSLWMKAVERNDRKWLMLAAFLLSVAVGLLTVVAWRLEQLEHMQVVAPQVALLTMQAALQALEQHASGGCGGLM